jgi:putative hydrolase of the HAD superfamily
LTGRKWKQAENNVLALDIDGVLVHPSEELDGGRWDSRMSLDLGIDPDSLRQKFFVKYWPEIIVGQRDLKQDLAAVLPDIHPQVSAEQLMAYWFEHDARVDQAVAELVQEWRQETRGRSVAVSNQEKYRVAYLREYVGLSQLVDYIFWSGNMGVTKSDPEFYVSATNKLDVEPGQVWFFDDDIRNVEVAAAAGWNAHLFVNVQQMRVALASDMAPSKTSPP